jgi:Protein of unknown function (DUF3096)
MPLFNATVPRRRAFNRDIRGNDSMHIDIVAIQPLIALVFGILILILPRILNYLIAIYLIIIGLTGLFPGALTHLTH